MYESNLYYRINVKVMNISMSFHAKDIMFYRSRGSSISPSPSYQSRNGDLLQNNQENNHKQYETNLKPYNIPPPPFNTEIQK